MATGDNVLTAISVARQCNIIESDKDVWLGDIQTVNDQQVVIWKSTSFEVNERTKNEPTDELPWNYLDRNVEVAVTGKAFRHIIENKMNNPYVLNSVIAKAKVFARMGPDDKACLVEHMQSILKE